MITPSRTVSPSKTSNLTAINQKTIFAPGIIKHPTSLQWQVSSSSSKCLSSTSTTFHGSVPPLCSSAAGKHVYSSIASWLDHINNIHTFSAHLTWSLTFLSSSFPFTGSQNSNWQPHGPPHPHCQYLIDLLHHHSHTFYCQPASCPNLYLAVLHLAHNCVRL